MEFKDFSEARDALNIYKKAFKFGEYLDKLFDEALQAQNVIAQMNTKKEELAAEIDKLQDELARKTAEFEAELDSLKASADERKLQLQDELARLEGEIEEAKRNLQAWKDAIRDAKAAYAIEEAELQDKIILLREQADLEEARYLRAKADIEALKASLSYE